MGQCKCGYLPPDVLAVVDGIVMAPEKEIRACAFPIPYFIILTGPTSYEVFSNPTR
jgi:hypothetical protein